MKKIILLALSISLISLDSSAQERPVGLSYIDSLDQKIESSANALPGLMCLPKIENGKREIQQIGPRCFCIVRCPSGDKLFEYTIESDSWISIPIPSPDDNGVRTRKSIKKIFIEEDEVCVEIHWDRAEIFGNDDERPCKYDGRVFTLRYLQQF